MKANRLLDGEYVEPYAGGAALALELLFHEYVTRIHINDLSRPIHAFWHGVLNDTERLCKLVRDTPLTPEAWAAHKRVFAAHDEHDDLALGFATFYLNRTNRSGILNGGIIGGKHQNGPWKIDARFNKKELIYRIQSIAKMKKRISLTRMDSLEFLQSHVATWPAKTLIYLDPPYYVKGRELYYDFYQPKDHAAVANFVLAKLVWQRWMVSYDNVPEIRDLYKGCQRVVYEIGYSARQSSPAGKEVMFFSDALYVPPLVGPLKLVKGASMSKKQDEEYSPAKAQQRFEAALRGSRAVGPKPIKSLSPKKPSEKKPRKRATSSAVSS